MDPLSIWIVIAIVVVGVLFLLGGAVQTFRRQPIVAILCVIFLFPIWVIWAFVEVFLPRPE